MSFSNGSVRKTPPRPVRNISQTTPSRSHAPAGRKGSSAPKSAQGKPSISQAKALGKVLSGNKTNIGDQKAAQLIHAKNYENFFHAAVQALKNGCDTVFRVNLSQAVESAKLAGFRKPDGSEITEADIELQIGQLALSKASKEELSQN